MPATSNADATTEAIARIIRAEIDGRSGSGRGAAALARLTGWTPAHARAIYYGRRPLDVDELVTVAGALGVPLGQLLPAAPASSSATGPALWVPPVALPRRVLELDDLHALAARLGVRVEYDPSLVDRGHDGEYARSRRLIRLRPDMAPRLERTVLAHELAHAIYDDEPTRDAAVTTQQEQRAERWAALHLVDPDVYAAARERHGDDWRAIGRDCGVMGTLTEAFRDATTRAPLA